MTCGIHVVIFEAKSIRKVELIREIAWHAEDPEVLGLATECRAGAIPGFSTIFIGGIFSTLSCLWVGRPGMLKSTRARYDWHTMLHLQLYFQGHTGESSVPGMSSLLHFNCSCSWSVTFPPYL